ncbi:glutamine-hydrolyzing GMP synthase [Oligoflexus tunisiensis]|uniref:glutamine-hydrolyzing GMP synthase n=1 Tax=Oligoflexus tunisiensis TaxID=708132 RepID=UPI000A6BD824|nr:glutamine-hydrolyzing GMP synthase [Oligoflexus tunisiensis]
MQHSMQRPVNEGILILDYGSQYTLLITRRLRELGVYAEVIDGTRSAPLEDFHYHGIILSGGPDTVTEEGARTMPAWVKSSNKPVLGICYGMQLMAGVSGGKLRSGTQREYGRAQLKLELDHVPSYATSLKKLPAVQTVWMSHGDDVEGSSGIFEVLGRTEDGVVAVMAHKERPWIGLQFHPEVQHSEHGAELLKIFISDICKAPLNWDAGCMMESSLAKIRENVGNGKVLMAVSGGVDSTVAAVLLTRALGFEQVHAIFVDHGLLRKDEAKWVQNEFARLGVHLTALDRSQEFYAALKGVSDPEQKRKIIGRKFIEVFESFAKSQTGFTHLGQGTLYPDVIESAGHGSGAKVIKSHHNVGGLPEKLHLELCEPFRYLFKDEVRAIGRQLGIPEQLVDRHPFPGPGLAVRILGEIEPESVRILQEADAIFINRLREENLYHAVWQAFAVLLPVKSVGVMGDNRTYQKTCALRAVTASDGMTAGVGDLPISFLVRVSDEIVRKVNGINRVVYDVTTKPPATIEWE